jgi:DNA-binding CsgD family transcriptional regulator
MARVGSNKPAILKARVIEVSATGMSGRKIAQEANINRRTVARILAGPDAQSFVT